MDKILVTGGAGFIGSHLCEKLLSKGSSVICLDNLSSAYDPASKLANLSEVNSHAEFELINGDIGDPEILARVFERTDSPVVVIHLAALAGVRASVLNPGDFVRVNVEGTTKLLEQSKIANVKHFILGSTSSVYGLSGGQPLSEKRGLVPLSPYAASKRAAELMCGTYNSLYGMNTTILRFFTVYGPRQRPDMAIHKFSQLMIAGDSIPIYGDGSNRRDYTYVEDIADGIAAVLGRDAGFEVFNLGTGRSIHLLQVIHDLGQALGIEPKVEFLGQQLGDVDHTQADISLATLALGYNPKVSFELGIKKFADWYKAKYMHTGGNPSL